MIMSWLGWGKRDFAKRQKIMKEFRRFLGFVLAYRWRIFFAGSLSVVGSALRLVFPWAIHFLVDEVVQQNVALLNRWAALLLGLIVVQTLASAAQSLLLCYVGERVVADLRESLYHKLQQLDLRFFTDRGIGEIASRMFNDVTAIQSVITSELPAFLTKLLVFVGAVVLVIHINPGLAAIMLVIVPPVAVIARLFGLRLRAISTRVQDRLADATAILEETLSGIAVVKAFARESYELRRFTDAVNAIRSTALIRERYRAAFTPLLVFAGLSGQTLVLWYGSRQLLSHQMTLGELISFLVYTVMIAGCVGAFAGSYQHIQVSLGALHRCAELVDEEPAVVDPPYGVFIAPMSRGLHFEQVWFMYDEQPVLRDIELAVAPGEIVALVGPSGAGKTTLMNLIPRFYDPTCGRVAIDGVDLRYIRLSSLRDQIAIVPQEPLLFSGTVRENILYGRLDASDDEVLAAAKAANAHEFIAALPQGYDTRVGQRGAKLSMGQRQRITIARAILKNPRILLLDEATSSLDSESEGQVQEALVHLMQERTTFIIAHRLATVQLADRIVVMDQGKIVESGLHTELVARCGLYAHLCALQFQPSNKQRVPQELGLKPGIGQTRDGWRSKDDAQHSARKAFRREVD